MAKAFLTVRTFVKNCPVSIIENEDKVMVARLVDSELWYYGLYATWERAKEVAKELENGVILEVEDGENNY
jgi:glycyl-tRNA synthetase beta subunit